MNEIVNGYKVFNSDWTCRDKQYTCPGKFEEDVDPDVCYRGIHFCKRAVDCFNYYKFDSDNHVAEVIAYGDVAEEGDKCCTNKLEIVRDLISENEDSKDRLDALVNSAIYLKVFHMYLSVFPL